MRKKDYLRKNSLKRNLRETYMKCTLWHLIFYSEDVTDRKYIVYLLVPNLCVKTLNNIIPSFPIKCCSYLIGNQ